MAAGVPSYKGFRFPVEVISHCVWLYHRFPLSFREVEEMMMERGIVVSHETIRAWCRTFGQIYANGLRRRQPHPGDKWHLDEVFITIRGKTHYLWRAVDQDGVVLDILVTSRRDARSATRFFRKLLTGSRSVPRVLITDKLASYGVAHRRLIPSVEHRRSKYLNNRAENSQPTNQTARARDETLPLGRWRTAVLVRVQWDITALPTPPPPTHRGPVPTRDDHPIHHLEPGHRTGLSSRLTTAPQPPQPDPKLPQKPLSPNNLTAPTAEVFGELAGLI